MRWSDIPLRPTIATLRWFAGFASAFLGALAAVQGFAYENATAAVLLGAAAGGVGLCGLVYPRGLRFVFVGLMVLSYPVNWLATHLLLALVFYCLFTPLGLWFRLIGRDALARRFLPGATTYWEPKPGASGVRGYFRQS
jgi:hypothetical protein